MITVFSFITAILLCSILTSCDMTEQAPAYIHIFGS